jgi:phospholipid/cholesterol/gamma-HCH transport system permease protein
MAANLAATRFRHLGELVGRKFVAGVEDFGYGAALLGESLFWIIFGYWFQQRVRLQAVFAEMMDIGVQAIPVLSILAFANGAMMAMQGIYTLQDFGAESQVVSGIATSVTREFGVLIAGIVVAGRSGSAIAARIGTMQMAQEIDALRVIGVAPVRYLVAPVLIAMLIMMPILTILADASAIIGGAFYSLNLLQLDWWPYLMISLDSLTQNDIMQGLQKSLVFGVIIAVVGVSSGFSVVGGAEGVGQATTRAVVAAISWIVIADMVFTYFQNR